MSYITFFSKLAPNRLFIAIVLGAISGSLLSIMIPIMLDSVNSINSDHSLEEDFVISILSVQVSNPGMASVYFIFCVLIFAFSSISGIITTHIGLDLAKNIRMKVYKKVLDAQLPELEEFGLAKIISVINIDVPNVIQGAKTLPFIVVNMVTIVGLLSYLYYLNSELFFQILLAILLCTVFYKLMFIFVDKAYYLSREANDKTQEAAKSIIMGIKELKLDSDKQDYFIKNIMVPYENELIGKEKRATSFIFAANSMGQMFGFVIIGVVTFILYNYFPITQVELLAVVMVLIYLTNPIAIILGSLADLSLASVSYKKLNALLDGIAHEEIEPIKECKVDQQNWKQLSYENISYKYKGDLHHREFQVGPISVDINPGLVIFIVGGNGSGKSTLSKLLTTHYFSETGVIKIDSTPVNTQELNKVRQKYFAVFSDYYLFEQLLIEMPVDNVPEVDKFMRMLQLQDKVTIIDNRFSTTLLSDGQRKRLALLVGLLEEKDVYLFDEWTADQDPEFRSVFYLHIIPYLKMKGKAVIVISHDEKYFHTADKLIVMDEGKLQEHYHTKSNSAVICVSAQA